jgi:hypothetical protein
MSSGKIVRNGNWRSSFGSSQSFDCFYFGQFGFRVVRNIPKPKTMVSLHGGSWSLPPINSTASFRNNPKYQESSRGFRLVRNVFKII